MSATNVNQVIQDEDEKWYYWEETWCDTIGPFETKEEATSECMRYCHYLNTGEVISKPEWENRQNEFKKSSSAN